MKKPKKHAPGEMGPECGAAPFRFPEDIAVTLDERVTCRPCLQILARAGKVGANR